MAKNDVRVYKNPYNSLPSFEVPVEDRTTSSDTVMFVGEPVKIYGAEGGNAATHLATGEPAIATDIVLGITKSPSTETSTVDGVVEIYQPLPAIQWACAATTPANLATGILLDCVTFDLTGTTYTVDENEGSDEDVHGLRIMDYDSTSGDVYFIIKQGATYLSDLV